MTGSVSTIRLLWYAALPSPGPADHAVWQMDSQPAKQGYHILSWPNILLNEPKSLPFTTHEGYGSARRSAYDFLFLLATVRYMETARDPLV